MFTGIIDAIGRIRALDPVGGDVRLHVALPPAPADLPRPHAALTYSPVAPAASPVGAAHGCDRSTAQHDSPGSSPGAAPMQGRIESQDPDAAVAAMGSSYSDLRLGESIAVSGVCLTVTAFDADSFSADVSRETLARTTLGGWVPGTAVNLERAMLPTTRFGGHMVAGHVDGVGRVQAVEADARSQRWRFAAPAALMRYIAEKGSIAVDGVSLTVNAVGPDWFEVNLVPHTVAHTAFAETAAAAPVNLEVDLVARYVERLFAARPPA